MAYNLVGNPKVINYLKKSKYFKRDLGMVSTIEKQGERIYLDKDKFSYFYNTTYRATIYKQGIIGDISLYLDYYILGNALALYKDDQEFVFDFDEKLMIEKGPDFYLGSLLKKINEKTETESVKTFTNTNQSGGSKVLTNPGKVTYQELQEYLKNKNSNRFSIQEPPSQE